MVARLVMDVSIIILNYRSKGLIKEQLRHFFSQRPSCKTEVIVVDNNSHDGIESVIAERFPEVRCIQSHDNRGYAAGNNIGIRDAQGSYVLIVNPDIVLTAGLVDTLFEFMEEHPRVGIAGPKLSNADGSLQYSCLRFPDIWLPVFRRTFFSKTNKGQRWLSNYFMEEWDHAESRDVDWLFGACLMVRADALAQVGMLDERFFLYLEDTDWCRRFWEHGWEVWYVATTSAIHLLQRSSEGQLLAVLSNRSTRIHVGSFFKYLRKYWGKPNPHREQEQSGDPRAPKIH